MKAIFRIILVALALGVPAHLKADEPTPTGRILVLENDRILEGDIEQVGDQYRIRRSMGETWLPASKVRFVCANLDEAYERLCKYADLRDPDEHLRLARWCQLHGLKVQALAEAREADRLRPDHAESLWLLRGLERATRGASESPRTETKPAAEPLPLPEFNPDAMGLFIRRVQPIIMNTCGNCHIGNRGGSFNLVRAHAGELTNRRTAQYNLAAVLAQVNRERPLASPLLGKAVNAHWKDDRLQKPAPLQSRTAPAYRTLEDWVQLAMVGVNPESGGRSQESGVRSQESGVRGQESGGRSQESGVRSQVSFSRDAEGSAARQESATKPQPATTVDKGPPSGDQKSPSNRPPGNPAPAEPTAPGKEAQSPSSSASPAPQPQAPPPGPMDEFDPMIFNQQTQ